MVILNADVADLMAVSGELIDDLAVQRHAVFLAFHHDLHLVPLTNGTL